MFAKLLFILLYHIVYYTRVVKYTKSIYDVVLQHVPLGKLQNENSHDILLSTGAPQDVNLPTTSVVEMQLCNFESNDNSTHSCDDSIANLKCDIMEKQLTLCEPLLDNDHQ